jgi:4a-hydroxytetrahydrobiopterin dehydratase
MKDGELKKNLSKLNKNWKLVENKLQINLKFKNFKKAFEFMQEIAVQSEILNHHPLWTNDYNKLEIKLYTHDKGTITELDFKLAKIIDDKLYSLK